MFFKALSNWYRGQFNGGEIPSLFFLIKLGKGSLIIGIGGLRVQKIFAVLQIGLVVAGRQRI